jgi:hypothetical protein
VEEFTNYGVSAHDDIPDSLGFSEHFLDDARSAPSDPVAAAAAQRIMDAKAFGELIYNSSPEDFIDMPLDPIPDTEALEGTGTGEIWDPFNISQPMK